MAEIQRSDKFIQCVSGDRLLFSDSIDHWENAFLRLMGISDSDGVAFLLRYAERRERNPASDVISDLRDSWSIGGDVELPDVEPRQPEWFSSGTGGARWLTGRVRDDFDVGLAADGDRTHGWLADLRTGASVGPEEIEYELEYFEGGRSDLGYGSYIEQSEWRLEKARRQCREIAALRTFRGLNSESLRVLDVGSGYGYFMRASVDSGWDCEGVEISHHAAEVANELVGKRPFVGTLEDRVASSRDRFDSVVMWDFIEHVYDPIESLRSARKVIAEEGSIFLRTPNLHAIELDVFRSDYHSLKREHVNLFSPRSIAQLVLAAGFSKPIVLSDGHLLSGFVDLDASMFSAIQRGSDMLVMATVD